MPVLLLCAALATSPVEVEVHAATRTGELLLTVRGLAQPLNVPLWVSTAGLSERCASAFEATWAVLSDGRVYVDQHNPYCAARDAATCRVFEPTTGRWTEARTCLRPGFGSHWSLQVLGPSLVAVRSESEGVGAFSLVSWTPEAAEARRLLEVSLGRAGEVEAIARPGGVELRSRCELLRGGCTGPGEATGPVRRTWWTPTLGLRPAPTDGERAPPADPARFEADLRAFCDGAPADGGPDLEALRQELAQLGEGEGPALLVASARRAGLPSCRAAERAYGELVAKLRRACARPDAEACARLDAVRTLWRAAQAR